MSCLLKDGCPCVKTDCKNRGNCPACIRRHVEENRRFPVYCMRDVAKEAYGVTE